jgi:hypothetical protein
LVRKGRGAKRTQLKRKLPCRTGQNGNTDGENENEGDGDEPSKKRRKVCLKIEDEQSEWADTAAGFDDLNLDDSRDMDQQVTHAIIYAVA